MVTKQELSKIVDDYRQVQKRLCEASAILIDSEQAVIQIIRQSGASRHNVTGLIDALTYLTGKQFQIEQLIIAAEPTE